MMDAIATGLRRRQARIGPLARLCTTASASTSPLEGSMSRPAAVLLAACAVLLASCATPIPPSGGPRDETPPEVLEAIPAAGAVNVDRETMRITFSEYVDEPSFARAFSITPSFAEEPEFVWSGHTVEIRFPEPLRDNTTYVVNLDTELSDVRGVDLAGPLTLAFSTGPTINAGTIAGRVLSAAGGQPVPGVDVFAYAFEDSTVLQNLPARPTYRTQTDQSGAFRFEYLTEQPYFVAALRDQNRSLAPDAQEPFAPPPVSTIPADSTPVDVGLPWVLTAVDTLRPEPTRVTSLSQTRHRLRFSEPVQFERRDADRWALVDSSTAERLPIESLYLLPSEPREVYFTTPPLDAVPHAVTPAALIDTSGNELRRQPVPFTPSAESDTLQLRLLGLLPEGAAALARSMQPALRFNQPLNEEQLASIVTVTDSTGVPLAFSAVTETGTEYELHTEPPLSPGMRVEISVRPDLVANLDSTVTREYARIPQSETGELSGVVLGGRGPVVVQTSAVEVPIPVPEYEVVADSAGAFLIRGLPAGTYRLRAFVDEDEDGVWDGGLLMPYHAPEHIVWTDEPSRVRARWETSLPDTLRIPAP